MPRQHDLVRLRALAALGDEDLAKCIDADSVATMQRVMVMLGADTRASGFPVDRADFVATVREMDRLCREGSRSLGEAIIELGGGRKVLGDAIDHSVGLEMQVRIGDRIEAGESLARIFAPASKVAPAMEMVHRAIVVGEQETPPMQLIVEHVT